MISSPHGRATHSHRILALWLIAFVGVAVHLGACAWEPPAHAGLGAPSAAAAHRADGGDRLVVSPEQQPEARPGEQLRERLGDQPGEQPAPDERHQHVLSHGPGGRFGPVKQRTSRSALAGVTVGWLLAAGHRERRSDGGGRAHLLWRCGDGRRRAGARLLLRLCRART